MMMTRLALLALAVVRLPRRRPPVTPAPEVPVFMSQWERRP
jgi:hypothetical protein